MHMFSYPLFTLLISLTVVNASAIIFPRAPKGGGGRGGGGGGRSSGSGKSSGGSKTGRGGSGDTGYPAISYPGIDTGGRSANYFSGGGGKPVTLSPPSVFSGRQMGGGSRSQIPGTRSYGSGYPYSEGDIGENGVVGQPFPFGFWPIYYGGHSNSEEYGGQNETVESQRPGGDQVKVELMPNTNPSSWNTTAINGVEETYWMIGDRESVAAMLSLLVDIPGLYPYGCGVRNNTLEVFNASDSANPANFENVIQWYRASSFALAFEGYNNTYALNDTYSLGWGDSTPLPPEVVYSPFLQCINNTITAALPILDQGKPPLDGGMIALIVVGSIFGFLVMICFCGPCLSACRRGREDRKANKFQEIQRLEQEERTKRRIYLAPYDTSLCIGAAQPCRDSYHTQPYYTKSEASSTWEWSEKTLNSGNIEDSLCSSATVVVEPAKAYLRSPSQSLFPNHKI